MGAGAGGKAGGRLQVRKAAKGGWTPAKRAAFLEHLAATCNIAASARAVGMAPRGAHASRGKVARAEPVATLYEGGRVFHVGAFPALEDELCGLVSGGYVGPGRSPDRADALVWALTELCLRRRVTVGVRVV